MLILYSDDLTITGYQTFPETTTAPHIEAPEHLDDQIAAVAGYAKLTETNGVLTLPDNLPELAEQKRRADLATETRAERDRQLQELDKVVANPLRWDELTAEQKQAYADYRLALLDVPQQAGFPEVIQWPEVPA